MRVPISRRTHFAALLALVLVLLLAVVACTQAPPASPSGQGISAQNVWARPAKSMAAMGDAMSDAMEQGGMGDAAGSAGDAAGMGNAMEGQMQHGGANSAIYMLLANGSAAADRLVAAQADVSNAVEIHETRMEGDVMRMQQVEGGIEVPAGGQAELKPGGYHVMLIGLTRDLNVGDKFPVTLEFASGATLQVEAEVRQP